MGFVKRSSDIPVKQCIRANTPILLRQRSNGKGEYRIKVLFIKPPQVVQGLDEQQ